jgi:hypothetical protein
MFGADKLDKDMRKGGMGLLVWDGMVLYGAFQDDIPR